MEWVRKEKSGQEWLETPFGNIMIGTWGNAGPDFGKTWIVLPIGNVEPLIVRNEREDAKKLALYLLKNRVCNGLSELENLI